MTEIKSPFKFLDYYDSDDIQIFFGREDEEKVMYQLVKKNRFVLVYGPSGSGKTSLVQCGLARQFEPHEWIPVYVRRGNNINASLINELKEKFKVRIIPQAQLNEQAQLKFIFESIRKVDLRPIYLIFDQFEELLILGNEKEIEGFKVLLREIIEQHSIFSCNVIMLLQEEYFAWLDTFEKDLRGISDNRLRVEPMRTDDVKDVIKKSCDHFSISIENPEKDIAHIIDVLSGKHSVSLPYLQVYLDQLWKHAQKKQRLGPRTNGNQSVQFTSTDIRIFGDFKDVLFRFLKQRAEELQKELSSQFRGIDEDCLANVLDCFATIEGTKLPIPYTLNQGIYTLDQKAPQYLRDLKPSVLKFILDKLLESRILRADGTNIELAHDTLSRLIDGQRNSIRRRENEIRMDVQKGFEEWKKDPKEFLSYKKVKEYESFISAIKLEKEQVDFFKRSKDFREDEELEKLKRVKKFNRLKFLISLLVFLLVVGLLVGNHLMNRANSDFALVNMAYNIEPMTDKRLALRFAKYIYDYKSFSDSDAARLQTKITRIALDQSVQNQFAAFRDTLVNKVFSKGESDISEDGKFLFVKDSSIKIFSNGKLIAKINDIDYGYFLNKPNFLLLASNISQKPVGGGALVNFANHFLIYDCLSKTIDTIDLSVRDGYLYGPSVLFSEEERPNYSYRVTVTNEGGLVIPFLKYELSAWSMPIVSKRITFKEPGYTNTIDAVPSGRPLSHSQAKSHFISFENPYPPSKINVLTETGTPLDTFKNVQFGDFTEKGNVLFIRNGEVFIHDNDRRVASAFVDNKINAAYVGGDETYAVATTESGQIFAVEFGSRRVVEIKGELVGTDFKTKRIAFKRPRDKKSIYLNSFSGKLVNSFTSPNDIESYFYNIDSSNIMLLTKKDDITSYQHLYLLDRNLNVRASFGLTPNDSYGMSKNGSTFYYLRDNYLTIFKNNNALVNLLDFDKLNKWMDEKIACPALSKDTLVKYKVVFPKQRITRIFGFSGTKECPDD